MHEADDEQRICYCVNGHEQKYRGKRVPSNCSICNAPIDVNRVFDVPLQEEKEGSEAFAQEPAQIAEPKPLPHHDELSALGEKRAPAPIVQEPAPTAEPRPLAHQDESSAQHRQRIIFSAQQPPRSMEVPGAPVTSHRIPQAPPAVFPAAGLADQQVCAQPAMFQLDYFGEKIVIPKEGCWLGRSSFGENLFEGNLLISREHVHVMPTAEGGLQIGPDHSLNGTYIDTGKGKSRLEKESLMVVDEGTVIWLYNIPLKVERKKQ